MFQVNLALSVIYSCHLSAILLGNWSGCDMITSELMDNSDEVQLVGLLDILQRLESKELFEKVSLVVIDEIKCLRNIVIYTVHFATFCFVTARALISFWFSCAVCFCVSCNEHNKNLESVMQSPSNCN